MKYRLGWRIKFYWYQVVDNDDFSKPAYSWFYFKFPRFVKKNNRIGFAWGVVLRHGFEGWFWYGKYDKRWAEL